MLRLFLTHSLRYFARHPALTALNIVGIALGVTVFLAVQIINHSALESFRASVDIVAGKANLELVGDGLRFDERARSWRVDEASGLVEVETSAGRYRARKLVIAGGGVRPRTLLTVGYAF